MGGQTDAVVEGVEGKSKGANVDGNKDDHKKGRILEWFRFGKTKGAEKSGLPKRDGQSRINWRENRNRFWKNWTEMKKEGKSREEFWKHMWLEMHKDGVFEHCPLLSSTAKEKIAEERLERKPEHVFREELAEVCGSEMKGRSLDSAKWKIVEKIHLEAGAGHFPGHYGHFSGYDPKIKEKVESMKKSGYSPEQIRQFVWEEVARDMTPDKRQYFEEVMTKKLSKFFDGKFPGWNTKILESIEQMRKEGKSNEEIRSHLWKDISTNMPSKERDFLEDLSQEWHLHFPGHFPGWNPKLHESMAALRKEGKSKVELQRALHEELSKELLIEQKKALEEMTKQWYEENDWSYRFKSYIEQFQKKGKGEEGRRNPGNGWSSRHRHHRRHRRWEDCGTFRTSDRKQKEADDLDIFMEFNFC